MTAPPQHGWIFYDWSVNLANLSVEGMCHTPLPPTRTLARGLLIFLNLSHLLAGFPILYIENQAFSLHIQ